MSDDTNDHDSTENGVPPTTERFTPENDSIEGVTTDESSAHRWIAGQTGSGVTYPTDSNGSDDSDIGETNE